MDTVVSVVDKALAAKGLTTKTLERWKTEMPTEQEMLPKDKYTIFDKKEKKYRKGIHSEFILSFWGGSLFVWLFGRDDADVMGAW